MDNRRTTKKARRETIQEEGTEKEPKTNSTQKGGGFSLTFVKPDVLGRSGLTSHDIAR